MKLYLYRHGETEYNSARLIQGRGIDSDLNEEGRRQAQAFFEAYREVPFERLYTSTLKRTQQTAAPFEQLGIPTERRQELDEISWGEWEGQSASKEMRTAYLGLLERWSQGDYVHRLAGGDSALDMEQYLTPFVAHLKTLPYQHVLICAHGGSLGFLIPLLLNEPLSRMPAYKHHNTGLDIFEYQNGRFELLLQDDTAHL